MTDKENKRDKYDIELPASIIESFARFLNPEIRKYYDSEQGQQEFGLYNKSWGKEQKSGQSKPNQVKWKCKNPQPEEGILCPRKIIAQNS